MNSKNHERIDKSMLFCITTFHFQNNLRSDKKIKQHSLINAKFSTRKNIDNLQKGSREFS